MTVKDLIRPLPGVHQLSLMRQRVCFRGSTEFCERKYARGGTSGAGSYGALGEAKAEILNAFVRDRDGNECNSATGPPSKLHLVGRRESLAMAAGLVTQGS